MHFPSPSRWTTTLSAFTLAGFSSVACGDTAGTNGAGGSGTDSEPMALQTEPDAGTVLVGEACKADSDCTGPGQPQCLTDGLYPLQELAASEHDGAKTLSELGVDLPGGYCSTVAPCATDFDCGAGGTCFFPIKNVDPTTFKDLVGALELPDADTAVLEDFSDFGQCLTACASDSDCTRDGYVCDTPIGDFLELVPDADLSTFCIGAPNDGGMSVDHCADEPCERGTCEATEEGFTCECPAGYSGAICEFDSDECGAEPCANGTCTDQVNAYACSCELGWKGKNCDEAVSGCGDAPCINGTCTDVSPGVYSCACDSGWSGDNCDLGLTTHCTLTFTLATGNGNNGSGYTNSNMRIRDTTAGLGDGTRAVGPGTLVIRVPSDGGQNVAAGTAEVLYYSLPQVFSFNTFGLLVETDVTGSAGTANNLVALATGTLALGATPAITWSACTFPADYDNDKNAYTPDVIGTGAGCLAPYRSVGTVTCTDNSGVANCSSGNLSNGVNNQDETWEQKLETFTFAAALASFQMPLAKLPNRAPSRTSVSLGGTLATKTCE